MPDNIARLAPIQAQATINKAPALAPRSQFNPASAVGTGGAVAGSALSFTNPILGLAVSAGSQLLAQYLQNKYTQDANELARKQFLQDRHHDELYNSPAMQKLRLKEAGLSPADFVSSFETSSSGAPTLQVPDMSFLSSAGSSGIQGIMNMQTYQQNKKESEAQLKLLYAQAEEAYQRAKTSQERFELENANKRLQNSVLGQQISKFDLDVQNSNLDIEAKTLANNYTKESQGLALQLLTNQVEGAKLSNDLQSITIKGRKYELDNILPKQVRAMDDKHKLDEQQLILLGLQAGILAPASLRGNMEHSQILEHYEDYLETIQYRLDCDRKTAEIASRLAFVNYLTGQNPINGVGMINDIASALLKAK